MKKSNVIGVLAALVAASTVVAVEVTPEQAQTAARNWVRRSPRRMTALFASGDARQARTSRADDGKALYHVVEMDGGGFVVTSGDTELPPVIAFSANGALDLSDRRNPLVALLERDLANRKAQLAKPRMTLLSTPQAGAGGTSAADASFEGEWAELLEAPAGGMTLMGAGYASISDVRVEPMVQSQWDQSIWNNGKTFNYYTPGNYVCGCVATAFAQIMRYWQKPTASVSAGTYTCWVDGKKVSKTMKGGTYNWGSMPLTEADCTTDTKRQAIGKLTYDVGVAAQMDWTLTESGTLGCVAAQALRNRFGYASAHSYCNGDSGTLSGNLASNTDFRNAILASLDASMPVAIGIRGEGVGGHAVIVDGYGYNGGSLIYCHINCGWSGADDAWYNLIGEGVTRYGFSEVQDVAYNIHPTVSGDVISGRVLNSSGAPVSGATVTLTTSSGSRRTTTTNAKGIYSFRAPADASYTVSASDGNTSSAAQTVSLPPSYDTEWTITDVNADGTVSFKYTTPSLYPYGKLGNKWGVNLTLGSSSPQPGISLATAVDNTTLTFTTGGAASWYGQAANSSDGVDAARSGAVGDGQQSWLQTTVTGPGVLSFYWNVSCEGSTYNQNWDYLNVSIDDEEKARICGTDNGWTRQSYSIPSGTHTVRWQYNKDGSLSSGDDAGYVDQIAWTPTTSPGDAYDPGDDTPGGGTPLAPSDGLATHGGHTLSATDNYDFFKVNLSAGYKYVFETTGSMDTYGDLFDSTSLANSVACDDDGGSGLNFKLEYAPESSGTYYLRVRAYTPGTAGSYALTYRREGAGGGTAAKPDLQPYTPSGWTSPLVVSASNISKEGATTFTKDDSLYVNWAVVCRNADASGIFESRLYVDGRLAQSWRVADLQKNYYAWVGGYLVGKLEPGVHTLRIVHDETGAVAESDESNNAFESSITVTADGFPNLRVSNASVSVSTISLSDPLTVHWRVQNDGQAAAAKSKTRFSVYKETSGTAQPQLMKTIWLDCAPLAAGAGRNYKQSVSLKSFGTGTYSFVIGADGKSTVAESCETDNDDTAVAYVVKDISTRSTARVDWQFHKLNASEPAAFYLSTSEKSKKKVSTFTRGQKIYVQLNLWNAKKNVRTVDGVYARIQVNGGGSRTWYWGPMGSGVTGYISNGSRAPSFLQNLPAGTYTLTATLDCYDNWWEPNEKNNVRRLSFTVVDAPTIHANGSYACALRESVCWAVSSEAKTTVTGLPPGLKYSGGAIVGKPTKAGTYTAKFTAKNAAGTKTKTIRIVVTNPGFAVDVNVRANGATEAVSVRSGDSVPMFAGVVQRITVASTPGKAGVAKSAASSVTATGLPPGLKYAKGTISGAPSRTGTYTVKLVFRNALGWSKSFTMKMVVSALPAFARGTFNGWTYLEDGGAKRKVTVSVTSAGKISAKVGSLSFSRTGWTVGEDGRYSAKMLTTRTVGKGASAKKYSDVLVLTLDPEAPWTEDQLTGSVATFTGHVALADALAAWEGGTRLPQNADAVVSARRNPFGDNAEAKAVAAELAALGTQTVADASGIVWDVKVASNGVATLSRVTGSGKNKKTVSASAVVNAWTDGTEYGAAARFLVNGTIVEVDW